MIGPWWCLGGVAYSVAGLWVSQGHGWLFAIWIVNLASWSAALGMAIADRWRKEAA